MTIQDFKDQVARDVVRLTGYDNFDQMYRAALNGVEAWYNIIEVSDRAAELYAKAREEAVRKWTFSVEELPEKGLPVLIWQEGWDKPSIGSLKIPDFRDPLDSIFDTRGSFQSGFTHWMPLPSNPWSIGCFF